MDLTTLKNNRKMKRHLTTMTLLALLLAAAGTLKAQQAVEFAPVGAEWYYERLYREGWNLNGITYDRFRSLRTVEINGWECREIELYQHLDCYGVPNPNYEIRYVTQEGDRVYEVEDGQRFLLYDFGKGPGESWYAPKYQTTVTVHRVDSMTMNDNTVRKVLVTEPSNNWVRPDWLIISRKTRKNILGTRHDSRVLHIM